MAQLLFPLLLVALLVPMFLGVRRQKREAQKVTEMQEGVKVGDRVTTTSGLYGTVVDLDETTVDLEIAEDVVTTWLRAAIREVRTEDTHAAEPAATDSTPAEPTDGAAAEESVEETNTRLTKD
ncbi:preprotein translocase subunit YajC [Nocardia terpenica]|uniref:Preprotein translocase n=1 Tax=Nocardia terpenica TaxID=455432 RepID=A0A164NLL0_9NOCA|nr:preprotein translocase subunit YajC [Nocardia terpenica]KZM74494.1 preprotein translocase [Nocardia terpenica]MBF6059764.1 preprotein translocase subunit YajC [Nocardia terpenica]MBF6102695.1 preprotein translocase subunit YajC [Nocardia terpenica]MBF6111114.1 preprotein translocase subunit YajC [Nocardia terpenica]MBF6117245.1 preprotein translocase subunit YajC [Nocardia terpenica]